MKRAICYFTSTGNSYDLSIKLSKQLGIEDLFYIKETKMDDLKDFKEIILIYPIYAFTLPMPVREFIDEISKLKGISLYVILNYGGFSANAENYNQELIKSKGINLKAVYKMKMPVNMTVFFVPPNYLVKSLLKKSTKRIERISKKIKNQEEKNSRKNIFTFFDKKLEEYSYRTNETGENFIVSDKCNKCGYCEKICPVENIKVDENGVNFLNKCVICLGCYHRCPKTAINYGKNTEKKKRYTNPNVNLDSIYKNKK